MWVKVEDEPSDSDRASLPKSRFSLRDLISESVAGLVARPARTALTALGTVLGVAALVATLGLAEHIAVQASRSHDFVDDRADRLGIFALLP